MIQGSHQWLPWVITDGLFMVALAAKGRSSAASKYRLLQQGLKTHNTVNFLNIWTPKKFVVITLKFELCGSTIE